MCLRRTGKGFTESGKCTLGSQPPSPEPWQREHCDLEVEEKVRTSVENYALSTGHPSSLSDSDPMGAVLQLFVSCS